MIPAVAVEVNNLSLSLSFVLFEDPITKALIIVKRKTDKSIMIRAPLEQLFLFALPLAVCCSLVVLHLFTVSFRIVNR